MRFLLDVEDSDAIRRVDGLADRAENMRPLLFRAGDIFRQGIGRQFESQGSYFGQSWPPLAASTVERKAREGLSPDLMRASGALEAALTGGKGALRRLAKYQIRVGTSYFVARFHQGERKLVGVARADRARVLDMAVNYLIRGRLH